jgi:hypothetical protein|tara:strand:+ start:3273 stop:3485 length:213 start_codon:yes stop_codon:yes gene_type:complete
MKFILTLIMCAGMSGQCIEPYEWPTPFDSMYECLQSGYAESSKKLEEMGPENVNKVHAHIKFYCKKVTQT